MPIDNSGMSKCEQLAAWWAMKKAHCESSNWQTYDCQETLRIFTGCADPALVMPTPDGDGVVCPHVGSMTNEDFRRISCEKKSMVMMPSGFGTQLCVSPGNLHAPSRDICLDPRAQCRPDMLIPDEPFSDEFRFVNPGRESPDSRQRKSLAQTAPSPAFSNYKAIKKVGDDNFNQNILGKGEKTHFVVFASKACGPCHKVLDIFNDESSNFKKATFSAVDVSQNPELSERFEIKYTPTILVFNKGKLTAQRKVGGASREVLIEYINRAFNMTKKKKLI